VADAVLEVGIYVPQVALSFDDIRHRAERCEQLGIGSLWLYDHLYGPGLPQLPSLEAWTLATALLSCTRSLRVGHLVLCNQFRHPALLAKMATTLDVVSGGRLDLGIGSGSYEPEHAEAGLPWGSAAERSERLAETLEILTRAFASDVVDFEGTHYTVHGLPSLPRPVQHPRPPIVVGGAGERRTLPLVARYADVWNVPTYALGELDRKIEVLHEQCERIGRDPASIRLSVEAVLALAPDDAALPSVRQVAERRFGDPGFGLQEGGLVGTAPAVVQRLRALHELGFDQVVLFTHDRAADETLERLASDVLPHL
jgi:alkanesulfonate monooxygenase SsuD/methylene tetrahydromethanopterin reductase-like flavin-dependent oxidoreductase (luciferase family)